MSTQIESSKAWLAYLELRKKKQARAPFTEVARERILAKLRAFEGQGHKAEDVLWQSVENGWTGVFPVKKSVDIKTAILTIPSDAAAKTLAYLDEHKPQPIADERRAQIAQQLRETKARLLQRRTA